MWLLAGYVLLFSESRYLNLLLIYLKYFENVAFKYLVSEIYKTKLC